MARLTERGVQTAKPGRHSDGHGLHLVVSEAGRKKWVLRYQVAGVRKDKGLGAYPAVGLLVDGMLVSIAASWTRTPLRFGQSG